MVSQSHSELLRHNCKKKRSNYGVKGEETLNFYLSSSRPLRDKPVEEPETEHDYHVQGSTRKKQNGYQEIEGRERKQW